MKKLMISAYVMAVCGCLCAATYSVSEDQTVLTVDVATDESADFDVSQMPVTVAKIVKTGGGVLLMKEDLSAYTFDVDVRGGLFQLESNGGLGDAASTNHSRIDVADGATIALCCASQDAHRYREYHVAGRGAYSSARQLNLGAIMVGGTGAVKDMAISYKIVLEDDAWIRFDGNHGIADADIDVNGHDLRFRTSVRPFFAGNATLTDSCAGKTGTLTVDADSGFVSLCGNFRTVGTADNRIVVKAGGVLEIDDLGANEQQWTLDLSDGGTLCGGQEVTGSFVDGGWDGPVLLGNGNRATVRNHTKTDAGIVLKGKVSGNGGFHIDGFRAADCLDANRRAAVAGLIEGNGEFDYSHDGDGISKIYSQMLGQLSAGYNNPTLPIGTNTIETGTRLMYADPNSPSTGWGANKWHTYSGYIWNDSETNEVWSFAGISDVGNSYWWRLDIDGQLVVGCVKWYGNTQFGFGGDTQDVSTNVFVMTPGPHRFEYRSAAGYDATEYGPMQSGYWINNGGQYQETSVPPEVWKDVFGLAYNRTGICSREAKDYEKLIDPGDGSLFTWEIPESPNPQLSLANPENDFTGGVSGENGTLNVHANGAIPATGGPVAMTNSICRFLADESYDLPAAEFSVSEGETSVVSGGAGEWAVNLVKAGEGELVYRSGIGSDLLDVRGGSFVVDMAANQRAAVAGLIEGNGEFDYSHDDGIYKIYSQMLGQLSAGYNNPTLPIGTNTIETGTRLMYADPNSPSTGWGANKWHTYSGYIWNDSETNEVWSFAGISDVGNSYWWRLDIDGQLVVGCVKWYGSTQFGFGGDTQDVSTNVFVMTPGPHRFEYRSAAGYDATAYGPMQSGYWINNGGQYKETSVPPEVWKDVFGLAYNRTGICSREAKDYEKLIDPGDGSLFTWEIPSPDGNVHPVTGKIIAKYPKFGNAKFALGASADMGGDSFSFARLEGWPTLLSGGLTVTERWTFDPTEVGTAMFAVPGPLVLGDGLRIVFPDGTKPDKSFRGDWQTLGVAEGGIVGTPMTSSASWTIAVDADGKTLKARYDGPGMVLLLR